MSSDSFISSPAPSLTFIHANGFILICMWIASSVMSNIHFNWGRLISTLMNSRVPWLFPYFRRLRGLNLSTGICAGDDHAHLKENNTLPPKHLAPAWGWASLQSSSSHFGSKMKMVLIPNLFEWLATPHLSNHNHNTDYATWWHHQSVKLPVEVSHLPGWKRRTEQYDESELYLTWKSPLMLTRKCEHADFYVYSCY